MKNLRKNFFGQYNAAFTLIEILLVISLVALLAGIVIFAVNPAKQLADGRNAQRKTDVNTILNAIYQYALDNNGSFPASLSTNESCASIDSNSICKSSASSCTNLTDLSVLTTAEKYLISIPNDPSNNGDNYTGYYAHRNNNGRVEVCAPAAEQGATISVAR
ncbi:MAG: type II secretion system protein [Candidatus Doudnabacteria bacterium]|nr:type II secretion system protein [Candidatus Doudnabacteria bacterium]